MNALARQYVGQGDACRQHSHPHLTRLRLRALLFNHLQCIGPAVVGDDDSRVSHEPCSFVSIQPWPLELLPTNFNSKSSLQDLLLRSGFPLVDPHPSNRAARLPLSRFAGSQAANSRQAPLRKEGHKAEMEIDL